MATIRVNENGYLILDFRYKGKRYRLSTGLSDNKENRKKVSYTKGAIEFGIRNKNLDMSIYFPQIMKPVSTGNLCDFFEYYIKEKSIRYNTLRSINAIWKNHIEPYFGHFQIGDISNHEIKVFRVYLDLEKKLKKSSINQIMTVLSGILHRACDEERIAKNPCVNLKKLKADKAKIEAFSFEELRAFLDFLAKKKDEYHEMIYIWVSCGFRLGEILALKWSNLDYFNRTLYVEYTLLDNGSEGPPKTESSQRHIPLRLPVIEAFKRQEKRSKMRGDYIFPDPVTEKRYHRTQSFYKRFKYLLQLAGLKTRSPNQLRHTFATLHIAAGENITWVSKMLGHSTVKMTLDKYNQYVPDLTREDGSAFDKALNVYYYGHDLGMVVYK